jgi:hypothetical protein
MEFKEWWNEVTYDIQTTGMSPTHSLESVRLLSLKAWYDGRAELLNEQIAASLSKIADSKAQRSEAKPSFIEPNADRAAGKRYAHMREL